MKRREKTLIIRTPEGIVFPLLLAGPVTRFLAWLVDWMCITAAFSIINQFVRLLVMINRDFAIAFMILLYFFLSFSYAIITEWYWHGQTIGKRVFKLKVMDVQGLRLQFSQVVIRNVLRVIDILPLSYMVGGLSCFFSGKGQRIGDIAANTIVIRTPKIVQPELEQIQSGKFNSFRQFPHLCARLRQKISPDLAHLTVQALLRRSFLSPDARVHLFKTTADHIKKIVAFPQTATEGLSDEQYIRNIVDILFDSEKNNR